MEDKKVFYQGKEMIIKKIIIEDPETHKIGGVPAKDITFDPLKIRMFLARRESGSLMLFQSYPKREVTTRKVGRHCLGTWLPTAGWCVELRENKLQKFEEVTWEGGPVEVDLCLTRFKIE